MSKVLPSHPNRELLHKQAKELRKAVLAGAEEALERVTRSHSRFAELSAAPADSRAFSLQDAQFVLAREYGFLSWPRLMERVAIQREIPLLRQAIDAGDAVRVRTLIQEQPKRLQTRFEQQDRWGRVRQSTPLQYALGTGDTEIVRILIEAGADVHELDSALFGCCEGHDLERMKRLIDVGVDPDSAYNEGWDCHVLYGLLQTYTRSKPEHLHACVELLIEAGAAFENGPVMDIHRGRLDRLEARLQQEPELVHRRFYLDYGDHLTLRGATLLHVAAEYGESECIDLLLRHGADLDAPCAIGANGVGGQTPIFHAIGSNQGSCFSTFEHLLGKEPDLLVRARVQRNDADDGKVMDCVHKNQDHYFDEVWTLTPLGYALRYEEEPGYRNARREAARLRELGAPEE